ncbi:terminase small subunit [Vibrio fluvialis]|nr:terminase small subunit [Vibrio fluvialis]
MLIDLNPTKAVRRTGCYSHKYAKQQAWRLMRNPIVRARIAELMDQRIQSAVSVECVGIRSNRDASKLMLSRDTAWLMNYQD